MNAPRQRRNGGRGAEQAPRRALDVAEAALRRFRRAGEVAPEVPTPERLLWAQGTARAEPFRRTVEVGGGHETATVEAHRVRIEDSPLSRLRARHLLAAGEDAAIRNAILASAGERYRLLWHSAGLSPLHALDPSRERTGGGAYRELLQGERQIAHFQAYGAAAEALSGDKRRVVEAIVLHEREPVDVGRELSGYRQEKQATAIALYLLRGGLQELAVHFGFMDRCG